MREPSLPLPLRLTAGGLRRVHSVSEVLAARLTMRLFTTPLPTKHWVDKKLARLQFAAQVRVRKVPFGARTLTLYEWPTHGHAHADAPQVLLTHGWAGAAKQFVPLGNALSAAGWRVTAIDHVAHGKSSGYRSSLPLFVQALEYVAQPMGEIDLIVGHSMGAGASAIALRRGLRAQRFISIASPRSLLDVLRGFIRSLHLPESIVVQAQTELERFAGMRLAAMEATANGPHITQPTLLIHDKQDKTVGFHNAQQLAALIPHARLIATEGLGHNRILADAQVIENIVRFAGTPYAAQ